MSRLRSSSIILVVALMGGALGAGSALAESMDCSGSKISKERSSYEVIRPGDRADLELRQYVRVDVISSKNPELDGTETTVYTHEDLNRSATGGTNRHIGYGDFVLKVKFRLHDHAGNSGIQYRSEEIKERDGKTFEPFVVGGYQADVASDRHMGILYGEKTPRGIIKDVTPEIMAALEKAVVKDGWNEYVITAQGHHVTQVLNGVTTVDIEDPEGPTTGIIALQLHRGHNMKISFKDIQLKPLD